MVNKKYIHKGIKMYASLPSMTCHWQKHHWYHNLVLIHKEVCFNPFETRNNLRLPMACVIGRIILPLKILIPSICEYITLQDKRDFADMVKIRDLEMGRFFLHYSVQGNLIT